jgi:hypothetical protein
MTRFEVFIQENTSLKLRALVEVAASSYCHDGDYALSFADSLCFHTVMALMWQ